jgi:mRNA interferase HigB
MHLIAYKLLDNFAMKHASARRSIAAWKKGVKKSIWKKKQDVLLTFPNAKMIKNNRARFEIHHNKYRLIAEVSYRIDPSTI